MTQSLWNVPDDFWEQQRRSRWARTLYLSMHGEPERKGPRGKRSSVAFQQQVLDQMTAMRRRPFTGPIVLDLQFYTKRRNPPAIHQLAKNVLDLLGTADARRRDGPMSRQARRDPVQGQRAARRRRARPSVSFNLSPDAASSPVRKLPGSTMSAVTPNGRPSPGGKSGDVATSGVVHEDVDATMSSDDLGHCLVMAQVWGRALASARITPA
ncbi:hypothetical protein IL992_43710 [Microbispora sp. NEAU-D428]|uniref:hypothetical protein n=1 Tax=Microbispora sitophila TaxID=2771537 RepID=UPI00186643DC|nr:hypothetical protein [Microbispora sitophila]MBE3016010.1 hypothetical protein [Microbispora sitophila]